MVFAQASFANTGATHRRLARPSEGNSSIGCVQRREAACSCGQLRVTTEGDPGSISMCHCLACQRRTGSAFGLQARWPNDRVEVSGRYTEYVRVSDEGAERTFRFCPDCGATVFWTNEDYLPDWIAVAVGAFADPSFPQPTYSSYGATRRHPWLAVPAGIEKEYD